MMHNHFGPHMDVNDTGALKEAASRVKVTMKDKQTLITECNKLQSSIINSVETFTDRLKVMLLTSCYMFKILLQYGL